MNKHVWRLDEQACVAAGGKLQAFCAAAGALDVAFFIREMIESYPKMHANLLEQLRDTFHQLQSTRVCTTVLWILAEYSKEVPDISAALDVILASLGPVPFAKNTSSALPFGTLFMERCTAVSMRHGRDQFDDVHSKMTASLR